MTDSGGIGVGAALAAARKARGLSLADVAQQLKFAPRQLEALEQDRLDALPGATFARGMVRSYARLVRLDPEPLVERIAGRIHTPDAGRLAARYSEPVPFSDNTRRSTLRYLALSVGVLAIAGGVAWEWHHERSAPPSLAFVSLAKSPQEPRVQVAAPAPAAVGTAEPGEVAALPAPAEAQAPAPATPAPPAAAEPDPGKPLPGSRRIVLRVEREAWIQVRDSSERLLVSSLNPAGTQRVVYGRPPFTLVIGNAQHVQLTYDDRPVDLQPYVKVEVARLTLK